MDLDIVDFLPKYPNINQYSDETLNTYDDFYTSIYKKKEFYDERLPETEDPPGKAGILYKHQKIIARFLSSYTLFDQLLLLHEMGSGKTCSSIGAIETIRKEHSRFTGAMIFASGEGLLNNYTNELVFKCTSGEYIPEYRTELEKVHRINKIIKEYYSLHTFETFAKTIRKMKDEDIIKSFSNKIIVIDEVHNIRIQDKEKTEALRMYEQFWRFLHTVKNCKIILMSGTPMKDNPEEISSVMNLILPIEDQLPIKSKFIYEFFHDKGEDLLLLKKEKIPELKSKFKGRVSYLKAMQTSVTKEFIGTTNGGLNHLKVDDDIMSPFQTSGYERAWEEDKDKQKGIYVSSRQAILFVFHDGSYGREFFNNEAWVNKGSTKSILGKNKKLAFYRLTSQFKSHLQADTHQEMLNKLSIYSSKYARTISLILDASKSNKSSFVYCEFVKGSGCILFSLLLELFGFSKASGREPEGNEKLRYALVTNETATSKQIRTIVDRFNKPDNMYGKVINVIIGSKVISEGFSLKNIQEEHILTPHWNYSETAQAIARGWRLGSHNDLINAGVIPVVRVYQHVSLLDRDRGVVEYKLDNDEIISIDMKMYEISENKDISIKRVERVMKEAAFDCSLNYNRNLITGYDGERECDYTDCNYSCDGIDPNLLTRNLDKSELDYSTYQLYYNNPAIKFIIEVIKISFMNTFQLDLREIVSQFPENSLFDIITSLRTMINKSIIINNKYGFPSYLKEENDKFFLIDSLSITGGYPLEYYTKYPSISTDKTFNDIIKDLGGDYTLNTIDKCCRSTDIQQLKQNIIELPLDIQEIFLESSILALKQNINTNTRHLILTHFRNYFMNNEEGIFISWLLMEHPDEQKKKIRCLIGNDWNDCTNEYAEIIKEQKNIITSRLENNPYKHFGILSEGEFKIRILGVEEEPKDKDDKRKQTRGKVCTSWTKPELLNLIVKRLQIPIPTGADLKKSIFIHNNKSILNVKNIIKNKKIIQNSINNIFTEEEQDRFTIEDYQRVVFWSTQITPYLCTHLQIWFDEQGLIQEDIQFLI